MNRMLPLVTAVGAAVNGGVFFAFSSFVLPAFDRLAGDGAPVAMNAVNVTAVRPAFMTVLFGTAALSTVSAAVALRHQQEPGAALALAGSAAYLLGVVVVTVAANVPLNDRLAAGTLAWADYSRAWTAWNTVRAAAGVVSAALLVAAGTRVAG